MTPDVWSAVDDYVTALFIPADAALDAAQREAEQANLPAIAVSPAQGKFLHLLARIHGARRILEIGTLAGYSTIWLARALPPGGRLVTLEVDPAHAAVARRNIRGAGLDDRVEIRVGRASDSLPALASGDRFDLVFIDADKPSTAEYVRHALALTRPGGVIVVDNVVRGGAVLNGSADDKNAEGIRRGLAVLAADPRVATIVMQTVGSKGYDGFAIAIVGS
jgi:predicted O-methyltransferase YrrM